MALSLATKIFIVSLIIVTVLLYLFATTENVQVSWPRMSSIGNVLLSVERSSITRKPWPYKHIRGKACAVHRGRSDYIRLLEYFDNFARDHGIQYMLAYGTLLGQYRNEDIIPWDGDMDILLDKQYFDVLHSNGASRNFRPGADKEFRIVVQPDFVNVTNRDARRRWNCQGEVVPKQVDSCSFVSPMGRLIYGHHRLDFFDLTNTSNNMVFDQNKGKFYKSKDVYPIVKCTFMDVHTWCPRNKKDILEMIYGTTNSTKACVDGRWVNLATITPDV